MESVIHALGSGHWTSVFIGVMVTIPAITIIFLFTVPSHYDHYNPDFVEEIRPDRSMADLERIEKEAQADDQKLPSPGEGYAHFNKHRETNKKLRYSQSCTIVVLGDVARSPRMMYHAASLAKRNVRVEIVGYVESPLPTQITGTKHIRVHPLKALPKVLSYLPFLLIAPLKLVHQSWMLYHALSYRVKSATRFILLQVPPSMPSLHICLLACQMRNSRLVCDWHNTASSILSLRFGRNQSHPLVWLLQRYELSLARGAYRHLVVSAAMKRYLVKLGAILEHKITVVRDRPAEIFRPVSDSERATFLNTCEYTQEYASELARNEGGLRLAVSSTSWTADEDFGVLLQALVEYSSRAQESQALPNLLVLVTGRGPRKIDFEREIAKLGQRRKLEKVIIRTAFLPMNDYSKLLACADLGICLHDSSSGLDLPMKVADMFGAGIPVLAKNGYEAFSELIKEGVNGVGFENSQTLARSLEQLLGSDGRAELKTLSEGALEEGKSRWDTTWEQTVGKALAIS